MARYQLRTLAVAPHLADSGTGETKLRFSKQLAVVVYLCAKPNGRASRDELLGLLWEGSARADARRALRQVVFQIRHGTDPAILVGENELTLCEGLVEFDVATFRALASQGRRAEALDVYQSDFLATVGLPGAREFERWAEGMRHALAAERRQLLRAVVSERRDCGDWLGAARYLSLLIEADPYDLDARLSIVELLSLAGDPIRAASAAEEIRRTVAESDAGRVPVSLEQAIARAMSLGARPERRSEAGIPRNPEMVGRAVEFRAATEKWKEALAGRGGAVLVSGEGGIGKTRLVRELERRFRRDGGMVLTGACHRIEPSEPYAPLLDMARQAASVPGLGGASPPILAVLAVFVPEIAGRFHPAIQPRALPIANEALASSLEEAFAAIADDTPLTIILEDLHYASAATVELLYRIARRAHTCRVLVLATTRDYGRTAKLTATIRDFATPPVVHEIPLRPLDAEEVWQLVSSMAEVPEDERVRSVCARLVDRSGGIPLYVLEILKALSQSGHLAAREGRWRFSERLLQGDPLPVPSTAESILRGRLDLLGEVPAAVLLSLSAWGRAMSRDEIAAVSGLPPDHVKVALRALERARLVGIQNGLPVVVHDEIAQAALKAAPQGELARIHARAASLAEDQGQKGLDGSWGAAASHAAAAGDPVRALRNAARTAAALERLADRQQVAGLLRGMLDGMPQEVRTRLETALEPILTGRWSARRWLDEREGRARRRRLVLAASGALAVGLIAAAARVLARPAPIVPLGGGYIAVSAASPSGPNSKAVSALMVDSAYSVRPAPPESLPPGLRAGFPSYAVRPDQRVGLTFGTALGEDPVRVIAHDISTGRQWVISRFESDASPQGWLPDGSAFVTSAGYYVSRRMFRRALALVDSSGRVVRTILRDGSMVSGAWVSPDGERVVVLRSSAPPTLMTMEGREFHPLARCGPSSGAWSPDGERIACIAGDRSRLIIHSLTPLDSIGATALPASAGAPAWSPDGKLIALMLSDSAPRLVILDAEYPTILHITGAFPAGTAILGWEPAARSVPARLKIASDSVSVAAGSRVRLRVDAYDPHGHRVQYARGIRWSLSDSTLARLHGDLLTADRPGRITIVAALGRTIADSATIEIVPPPATVFLRESFEQGIDAGRWRPFGFPHPRVVGGAGRSSSFAFDPNGDNSHGSGVALRERLVTRNGLTIEWWARVGSTDNPWQELQVRLGDLPADSFVLGRGSIMLRTDIYGIWAQAPQSDDPRPWSLSMGVTGLSNADSIPPRLKDGRWHRFRLALYPSGELRWFADGRELLRPVWVDLERLPLATLELSGRSYLTVALMDDVTVWEGVHLDPPSGRPGRE